MWENISKYNSNNNNFEIVENTVPEFNSSTTNNIKLLPGFGISSERYFKNDLLSKESLINIFSKSFAKGVKSNHRSYGSAGALYPVIPFLIIMQDNIVKGMPSGIYSMNKDTKVLTKLNLNIDFDKFEKNIYPYNINKIPSKI